MKSQLLVLFGFVFATALCADPLSQGIYQSSPEEQPGITLTVASGKLILVTAHFPENAQWYSYGEYEGSAQPAGQGAWTATWAKKKATAGNFPVPARTPLTFANGQYVLTLGAKKIPLKKMAPSDLVFSGMYSGNEGIKGDILFAAQDKQSYLCALRGADSTVSFVLFPKNGAPSVLTQTGWQFRLTPHLKMSQDSAPRDGTGALVDVKDEKGSFQIQFNGTRTPESDAMLSVMRAGKVTDFTGNDHHSTWVRKDRPAEIIDAFGDYRRWKDAAHPLGQLYSVEAGDQMERWIPVAGGAVLEWHSKEGGPSTLVLADKTRVEFNQIEAP